MSEEMLKEISKILGNVLVFETKFKEEIWARAKIMSDTRLNQLRSILLEVSRWQEKTLAKKIKEDPDFYNEIAFARKKANQEIISLYKQKLSDEDQKKMEIILGKMKLL